MIKNLLLKTLLAFSFLSLASLEASAVSIAPTNLDDLTLGAKIVGPVGAEVETSLIDANGDGLGDLISSVSCPVGFSECLPPENPPQTIYTYIHEVTPGVDFPNDDPPFPQPSVVLPFENVTEFRLSFEPFGFTGVAGYRFTEATTALGTPAQFNLELNNDSLIWTAPNDSNWNTGETITFFWQTLQPPSGPGGLYTASNNNQLGSAMGPLPLPVQKVPESRSYWSLIGLAVAVLALGRRTKKKTR
ncbi:MAG: exosortase, PEP-CTERM interaction domain protein [Cyanobacteria bacterium P01_G01_bin.49]